MLLSESEEPGGTNKMLSHSEEPSGGRKEVKNGVSKKRLFDGTTLMLLIGLVIGPGTKRKHCETTISFA
jgi:hypothetical protein